MLGNTKGSAENGCRNAFYIQVFIESLLALPMANINTKTRLKVR